MGFRTNFTTVTKLKTNIMKPLKTNLLIAALCLSTSFTLYSNQNAQPVEKLNKDFSSVILVPEIIDRVSPITNQPTFLSPEQTSQTTISYRTKRSWRKCNVVKLHDIFMNVIEVAKKGQKEDKNVVENVIILS